MMRIDKCAKTYSLPKRLWSLFVIFTLANSACVITTPTPPITTTIGLVSQNSQQQVVVADSTHTFTTTQDCILTVFQVSAVDENGVSQAATYATLIDSSPTLSNVRVKINPKTALEATTPTAVYVQAVDLATKASVSFCFMVTNTAGQNFCCPQNYDKIGCLSCSTRNFAPLNSASTLAIQQSTLGCTLCDATNNFQPYLYAMPDGSVMRGCQYVDPTSLLKEDDQCSFGSVIVTTMDTIGQKIQTCTACDKVIDNCLLCTSTRTCLKCKDNTVKKISLLDKNKQTYDLCTTRWCYGCVECTIPNCSVCDWTDTNVPPACLQCQPNFYLNAGNCIQQTNSVQTVDLFVQQYSGGLMSATDLNNAKQADGTMDKPFYFIQQALEWVQNHMTVEIYQNLKVNIWLGKGDHFFFQCHSYNSNYAGAADITQFCSTLSIASNPGTSIDAFYPKTDTVDYSFKPLYCESLNSLPTTTFQGTLSPLGNTFTASQQAFITSQCIFHTVAANSQPPELPKVHVNDNHAYFNITSSMTFDSIEFRGENALAVPQITDPVMPTIPLRLCTVLDSDELNIEGRYERIVLTPNQALLPTRTFSCLDDSFDDVKLPMSDFESCTDQWASTNVNRFNPKCKFEPYRNEFFQLDSKSGIYTMRHQVLFNLYAFANDRKSDTQLKKVPSLTLINCKFKYFLKDYDALINIETDNFVQITQTGIDKPIMAKLGRDKGARIRIKTSSFSHSRFCKGLIAYKRGPELSPKLFKNFYFVADYQVGQDSGFLAGFEPGIFIENSSFTNLNHGVAIEHLSQEGMGQLSLYGYPAVPYPPYDNLGIVLNLQGFPGGIELHDSIFTKNLVYIPDIFPSLRTSSLGFGTQSLLARISEIDSYLDDNYQYSLKKCERLRIKRLFSDSLNSYREHPDQMLVKMERHTLLYISKPEQPVIIYQNTFADNIGIFGGAIMVDSPNMQANNAFMSLAKATLRPLILIKANKFWRNSAYSSGNAVYLRATRVRQNELADQVQTCGTFYITGNEFINNTAVTKSHNGGAVTVACDYVDALDPLYLNATSNLDTATPNMTIVLNNYVTSDSTVIYRVATGIVGNIFTNNTSSHKGLAIYTRHIQNLFIAGNTFTFNQPHMVFAEDNFGSVYYWLLAKRARHVSFYDEVKHVYNTCHPNKLKHMPPLLFCQSDDELDYMENHATQVDQEGLIDWPQVQGTVHVEGCDGCLISYKNTEDSKCLFCHKLLQHVEITGNVFDKNQGGVTLYKQSNLPRASQIFVSGGATDTIINNNTFLKIKQQIGNEDAIKQNLTSYYRAMFQANSTYPYNESSAYKPDPAQISVFPGYWSLQSYSVKPKDTYIDPTLNATFPGYWNLQQTPLIHIEVSDSINVRMPPYTVNVASAYTNSLSTTTFSNNQVVSFASVQPMIKEASYRGSVINFQSKSLFAQLNLKNNIIEDCYILGQDAALISVNGGSIAATGNSFERIGSLTNRTFTQNYTNFLNRTVLLPILDYTQPMQYASYFAYPYMPGAVLNLTMDKGIFWFETGPMNRTNATLPITNTFINNSFANVFCEHGCIYTMNIPKQSHSTHNIHQQNIYRNIYGFTAAIQLTVVESQAPQEMIKNLTNLTVSFQEYRSESVNNVQNGAFITIGDQNEVTQIFKDVYFENVFGNGDSAGITLQKANALYCRNCTFYQSIDPYDRLLYSRLEYEQQVKMLVGWNAERRLFDEFISNSTLVLFFGNGPAGNGSILLKDTHNSYNKINATSLILQEVNPDLWKYEAYLGYCKFNPRDSVCKSLQQFDGSVRAVLMKDFGVDGTSSLSLITQSSITSLHTNTAVLLANRSNILIFDTTITSNVGTLGSHSSIVFSSNSTITFNQTTFRNNTADVGACILATNASNLQVIDSFFNQNTAFESAGAIYVQGDSLVNITNSEFKENQSHQDGAVMAINENQRGNVTITGSRFVENTGSLNIISMSYSSMTINKCAYVNNFADILVNGFFLYGSSLTASGIRFTQSMQMSLSPKVHSGLFYLKASSQLYLLNQSIIQHTYGQVASVAYVESDSIFIAQDSFFLDILAINSPLYDQTGVIVGQSGRSITLNSCSFKNCDGANVYAQFTAVNIKSSIFYLGQRDSYIKVYDSQLIADNNKLFNATATLTNGKAIQCTRCSNVRITNNFFTFLSGLHGGAVYLEATINSTITSNIFTQNVAERGGGLYIFYSDVSLTNNSFISNNATNKGGNDWYHQGAGGAVFFTCANLDDSNSFYREEPGFDYFGKPVNLTIQTNSKPTCQLRTASNQFINNMADARGGAIMYTNVKFTTSVFNVFTNNSAPVGADISSPVKSIEINMQGSTGRRLDGTSVTLTSGYEFPMTITMRNGEGEVALEDSQTVVEIEFVSMPAFGLLKNNQQIANKGVFNFTTFFVQMQPGAFSALKLSFLNLNTFGSMLPFLQKPFNIPIYSRPCGSGEMLTQQRTCLPCPTGQFSIAENITQPSQCQPCLDHAICMGYADMTPQEGFFRVDQTSGLVLRCFNKNACQLPQKNEKLGKCSQGYEGYLCSECSEGYWRRENTFDCFKCPNQHVARFVWLIVIAIFLAFIIWIVNVFKRNFGKTLQITVPTVRMAITLYHFYTILSGLETFDGSSQVHFFLQMINVRAMIGTPLEAIFDVQCTNISSLDLKGKYYALMTFNSLLPLILYVFWFVILLAQSCFFKVLSICRRNVRQSTYASKGFSQTIKVQVISFTIITLYILYPKMVEQLLSSVHCFEGVDVGPGDIVIKRLRSHPEILCDDKVYKWFKGVVFIPALIIWVILLPIYTVRRFFVDKLAIYNSQQGKVTSNIAKEQMANEIKTKYGFLYVGLRNEKQKRATDEEVKRRKQQMKADNDYMKTKPNAFWRFYYSLTSYKIALSVFKTVVTGRGLDVEPEDNGEYPSSAFSFCYWEIVIYFGKLCLILLSVFFTDINTDFQANLALSIVAVLLYIQLKNQPYNHPLLNNLHVLLLSNILIITYTRTVIKDFTVGYNEWQQKQIIQGQELVSQEVGSIARLYIFETDAGAFFNNLFIVIIVALTFYVDLYFVYILYLQLLLYLKNRHFQHDSTLFQWITFKSKWLQNRADQMWRESQTYESDNTQETARNGESSSSVRISSSARISSSSQKSISDDTRRHSDLMGTDNKYRQSVDSGSDNRYSQSNDSGSDDRHRRPNVEKRQDRGGYEQNKSPQARSKDMSSQENFDSSEPIMTARSEVNLLRVNSAISVTPNKILVQKPGNLFANESPVGASLDFKQPILTPSDRLEVISQSSQSQVSSNISGRFASKQSRQ